ncbi:hypothetical protein BC827DRAFT_1203226 [Russula dissimulans]|nr:hypothetical protein BC827DRAFT_1203226 [Russula dissimulans]
MLDSVDETVCDAQQYQQSLSWLTTSRNVIRHQKAFPKRDWKLLRMPPDIYMLSLFIFDVVHAIGGILNVRWAVKGVITMGPYCSAQESATHTVITALWRVGIEARGFAFAIVGLTCIFIALWVGIANGVHRTYEAPSPYWCWISPRFKGDRLAGEYIWLWIALFASMTMYIPLYLWAEGRLSIGDRWYKFHLLTNMFSYPLAYALVVLPLSVARWSLVSHKDIPSVALLFGLTMFNLSGAINVLLFLIIRPQLLLFAPPKQPIEPERQPSCLDTDSVPEPTRIEPVV